jgi:ribosomal protein S18 acetylase RimI-like enzyme
MTTEIRRATADDIPHLARFQIMAYGGYNEVLYDGLMPGQSTESLVQPQFARPNTTPFYENHWIAMCDGQVAGGIHAFPMEDMAKFPPDPLVPEERYAMIDEYLYHPPPGTYYVNALSVYSDFRGKGIASILLSLGRKHAAEKGFAECSLYVFAENVRAVAFYKKHGFKEAGRYPVTEHPLLYFTGDTLLMTCAV